jgi:hypothetical protein
MIDFKNLSAEQDKMLREILEVCYYFSATRRFNISDETYAEQARSLGFKFQQLEVNLEESKQ